MIVIYRQPQPGLSIGQALPLVRTLPRWYEVQLPGGVTGFVSKSWATVLRGLAPHQPDELRTHFLNIGAGSCAVVECPGSNARPMIVDCGSTGATAVDMDGQQVRTYIRNVLQQHTAAPNVVLSHPDSDHYSHIPNALDTVTVASVWQGGDPDGYTSANFPAWLAKQQSQGRDPPSELPGRLPQQPTTRERSTLVRHGVHVCAHR